MNSSVAEPYHNSPMDAACEILWFSGIVVVVSGGNNGGAQPGILYPPANDPFVISVGAVDDRGTPAIADDVVATYSAYGRTESGFAKPDLVAPGSNIISTLADSGKHAGEGARRSQVCRCQHLFPHVGHVHEHAGGGGRGGAPPAG